MEEKGEGRGGWYRKALWGEDQGQDDAWVAAGWRCACGWRKGPNERYSSRVGLHLMVRRLRGEAGEQLGLLLGVLV